MSDEPKQGFSKKVIAIVSTGVAVLTIILCESGIIHVPTN